MQPVSQEYTKDFSQWLEAHPHKKHIAGFMEWALAMEETETGKPTSRKRQRDLEDAVQYLDILSMHLETQGVLKDSIFKPGQFFNADKLMRAAKKSGYISLALTDVPIHERPKQEEALWYTMRLYSTFLDFYCLTPEESETFRHHLRRLTLPKALVHRQMTGWITITVLLVLLSLGGVMGLLLAGKTSVAVLAGVLLLIGLICWFVFGLRQTLPFQFKAMLNNAELCCLRGQVCEVGEGRPFSSVPYETQEIHVSALHDSLGKSFAFYAINPVECETDGSLYQVVYIKGLNIVLETLPL